MVYTKNEEPMSFISFEDTTALFETVVFPEPFRRFCATWTQTRPYILRGTVDEEFGAFTLHVEEMEFLDARRRKNPGVLQDPGVLARDNVSQREREEV
jgi:DNA polymerase III alpha subunit